MTGKEIKEKRKTKGWTQQQLADVIGVHQVTVARWEIDQSKPHPAVMRLIKMLLD
jgi:transcriptional regulator with XRE-family HTH domain